MPSPFFQSGLASYCLFDRLREGLGDKVAIRFGRRAYTYADVAARASAFARYLRRTGITEEQRVYIVLPDSPAFAWVFFGALAAGAVVAMGNPDAPSDDLADVLDYVRARAWITVPRTARALGSALAERRHLRSIVLVPDEPTGGDVEAEPSLDGLGAPIRIDFRSLTSAMSSARDDVTPLPSVDGEDGAVWLFTSGSTGRPKAAMHRHCDFVWNTEVYAKATVGYRRDDVTVSIPRLFFGYATGTNLIFPFSVGATVGLFAERPTVESVVKAIAEYRPTIVTNVPTMMSKLLDHDDALARGGDRLDLPPARFHLSAGEALPDTLLSRFQERFKTDVYDGIGSAEMFHIYATNRPGDVRPGSLGRAVEGYTLRVLPPDAEGPGAAPLPPSETGILWVKGQSAASGYYRDRAASVATFYGDWCKTGDLFRIDANGYLWFAGRVDDLMKVSGLWVSPIEVEECLMAHPSVSLAAVVGVKEEGLMKPHAFVVLRGHAIDARLVPEREIELRAALQEHVRSRLAQHKYPRSIVFVDDLPKNDRGKIDRNRLREQAR